MNEQSAKKAGIVYILSNAGLEGLVKVGMVESLNPRAIKTRIGHLRAGSPYVYHVEGAARAKDAKASEAQLHDLMLNNRVDKPGGGTEWFAMTPEQAMKFLVALPHLALIPRTELDAAFGLTAQPKPKALPPHKKFTFGLLNIPVGAELKSLTQPYATCRVIQLDPPKVEYRGNTMSLTAATSALKGYHVSGLPHWSYLGRKLAGLPLN